MAFVLRDILDSMNQELNSPACNIFAEQRPKTHAHGRRNHNFPPFDLSEVLFDVTKGACSESTKFNPKFDLVETREGYEIKTDLPAYEKKDLEVSWKDERLVITGKQGEQQDAQETKDEKDNNSIPENKASTNNPDSPETKHEHSEEKPTDESNHATSEAAEASDDEPVLVSKETPSDNDVPVTITKAKDDSKDEKQTPKKPYIKYLIKERESGSFSRSFSFKKEVDSEQLSAVLKDGVLTIKLAKKKVEKPKPKHVSIE